MKKITKSRIKYLVVMVICLAIMILCTWYKDKLLNTNESSKNNNKVVTDNFEDYITSNYNEIQNSFKDREVIVNVNKKEINVGGSKNEIENGYFDIKLTKKNEIYSVYFNKLVINLQKDTFVDEEYLKVLVDNINKVYSLKLGSSDRVELLNLIKDNYTKLRKTQNQEQISKIDCNNKIINGYDFKFYIIDNMLKMEIIKR